MLLLLSALIASTGIPTAHCNALATALCVVASMSGCTTSALIYFRTFAIYSGPKRQLGLVLVLLWVMLVVATFLSSSFWSVQHLADTQYCTVVPSRWEIFPAVPLSLVVCSNTFVLVVVSWRIGWVVHDPSQQISVWVVLWTLCKGEHLPKFSKSILRQTQEYFL